MTFAGKENISGIKISQAYSSDASQSYQKTFEVVYVRKYVVCVHTLVVEMRQKLGGERWGERDGWEGGDEN